MTDFQHTVLLVQLVQLVQFVWVHSNRDNVPELQTQLIFGAFIHTVAENEAFRWLMLF